MSKFIKLFNNHTDYNNYINTGKLYFPCICKCVNNNDLHYNYFGNKIIATFNITDTSSAVSICYFSATSNFSKIEVDDVQIPIAATYRFSTTGEHILKYTLNSPGTTIGTYMFLNCTSLISVILPKTVTTISNYAFGGCTNLKFVIFGTNVTQLGSLVFNNCTSLESITIFTKTAPSILNQTFNNISSDGTLYILKTCTGYDTWMGTGNYYLGKYNWTKVEQ